jgi:PAS domain S-box-containing protein
MEMKSSGNIFSLFSKPEIVTLLGFAGFSSIVWSLHHYLSQIILGVHSAELQQSLDADIFFRADLIITILLTALIAGMCYLVLTQYNLSHRTHALAQEMLGDISLSREQFRMLYENSPVPYFLMDDSGSIHNPNKATWRFFEGTKEECEVMNFYQSIENVTGNENSASLFKSKIERGLPITSTEMSIRGFSGSTRWALVSIYSLDRSHPVPYKHLVTLIDVTKEKQSEQVKSDFLLLASHQLRTPMTTIKWYTDYLLNTPNMEMGEIVREYLGEINIGNERMIELVNTLLTVSRLEMGTLAPEYAPVNLNKVLQDVLTELTPDIKKRGTLVEVSTNGDDKLVTDKQMVRIAIHNLLTNAIKYSPQGGRVTVSFNFASNGCTLEVTDNGCGIPVEDQGKIFTKMFRASNAKKVSTAGTGLGLHLTRSFVEKLGGSIDFSSMQNKGTTFTIALPRVAPDA